MRSRNEGPREPAGPAFSTLPVGARLLIGGTTAACLLHLVWSSPSARFDSPETVPGAAAGLGGPGGVEGPVAASAAAAPRCRSPTAPTSRLWRCCRPFEATLVVAAGAWSQCVAQHVRPDARLSHGLQHRQRGGVQPGGRHGGLDGRRVRHDATRWRSVSPTLAAATAFFLCNSILMSLAVASTAGTLGVGAVARAVPVERARCASSAPWSEAAARTWSPTRTAAPPSWPAAALPRLPELQDLPAARSRSAAAPRGGVGAAPGQRGGAGARHRRARPDARGVAQVVGHARPARAETGRQPGSGGRHERGRGQGRRGRRAAARHRQAGGPRAHPDQARSA